MSHYFPKEGSGFQMAFIFLVLVATNYLKLFPTAIIEPCGAEG
jgi:hypothetical protein